MQLKIHTICMVILLTIYLPLTGLCDTDKSAAWKQEFARLCAQTESADTLSDQQVRELIEDSDTLLDKLQSIKDPQVKVYLFRLKKCRQFFEFTLQLRKTG